VNIYIIAERVLSTYCFVIGLALVLRPSRWPQLIKEAKKSPSLSIVFGFLAVILGSFFVTVHNFWELKPSLITTILGWLSLIKGLTFFICPKSLFLLGEKFYENEQRVRIAGVLSILLSVVIYYSSLR
jgi:uncharacterized protein YjeT (DUF2065 family)